MIVSTCRHRRASSGPPVPGPTPVSAVAAARRPGPRPPAALEPGGAGPPPTRRRRAHRRPAASPPRPRVRAVLGDRLWGLVPDAAAELAGAAEDGVLLLDRHDLSAVQAMVTLANRVVPFAAAS